MLGACAFFRRVLYMTLQVYFHSVPFFVRARDFASRIWFRMQNARRDPSMCVSRVCLCWAQKFTFDSVAAAAEEQVFSCVCVDSIVPRVNYTFNCERREWRVFKVFRKRKHFRWVSEFLKSVRAQLSLSACPAADSRLAVDSRWYLKTCLLRARVRMLVCTTTIRPRLTTTIG